MEDYKKKYEEALERARKINNGEGVIAPSSWTSYEAIFPELKESEDERIRKEIIDYLKSFIPHHDDDLVAKSKIWIAWLEKQGEHANFRNKIQIGDEVTRNEDGVLVNLSQFKRVVKQGKQKQHLELKAGHWYFCHQAYFERADTLTVKKGEMFRCEKDGIVKGLIIKEPEKYFREISTLSDKVEPKFKVVDIIRHKKQGFTCKIVAVDTEYRLSECNGTHLPIEWQDAYELVEQKPTWSEEDEIMFNNVVNTLEPLSQTTHSGYAINSMINWLKSIKERIKGE